MQYKKSFEQKRKILESEVTQAAFDGLEVDKLLGTIAEWEKKLHEQPSQENEAHLLALYNKAIEYYSATNNMEKSMVYLDKLKKMLSNPALQSASATTPTPNQENS